MDFGWMKDQEDDFEERMIEMEETMNDMDHGARRYLKRKPCGAIDYMFSRKEKDGSIDFIVKSGKPATVSLFTNDDLSPPEDLSSPEDLLSVGESSPNAKRENKPKKRSTVALLTQAAIVTPKGKRVCTEGNDGATHTKAKLCGHCYRPHCHAEKYGEFLLYIAHSQFKGKYNKREEENLKIRMYTAYTILVQWDKCVELYGGNAQPIDPEELEEEMPVCLQIYRDGWLRSLKKQCENANKKQT